MASKIAPRHLPDRSNYPRNSSCKEVGERRNTRRYARVGGSTPENHDTPYAAPKRLFGDGLVGMREA